MTISPPIERLPDSLPVAYARWDGPGSGFALVFDTIDNALEPGQVLVAIDLATVCGSDAHTVSGRRSTPTPTILGHEQVGRVVALGPNPPRCVDGRDLELGMRVVWSVTISCGDCARCWRGLTQKCERLRKFGHESISADLPLLGGFASHALLPPGTSIVAVPDAVPDTVAAPAACATATVAATLDAGAPNLWPGARVLVTGAGMLGLTAVAMATHAGAEVTVIDPHPERRATALRFGAAAAYDIEATSGIPGSDMPSIDLAIELSGAASAVRTCLGSLAVGGRLVLAGSVFPGPALEIDPERMVRGLHSIVGVHNYAPQHLQQAMDFLAADYLVHPFSDLVVGAFGLSEINKAFAAALTGRAPRQAVLTGTSTP